MPSTPFLWPSPFLSLCSFVIFAVIGLTLSRAFFLAQTDVMEIVDYGTDYATICLACSLGLFCQLCFERLLQSTGRTGLAMVTQLVGAVINIIFDPILIFGLNNAMVPIISYNYGAVKPERVKKTVRLSVIAATCIMIVGAAVFELFPTPLLRFFDASEQYARDRHSCPADHRRALCPGRLLHCGRLCLPGHRQPVL